MRNSISTLIPVIVKNALYVIETDFNVIPSFDATYSNYSEFQVIGKDSKKCANEIPNAMNSILIPEAIMAENFDIHENFIFLVKARYTNYILKISVILDILVLSAQNERNFIDEVKILVAENFNIQAAVEWSLVSRYFHKYSYSSH